jgi:uncharacterized protein (DUF2267 family)
MKYKVLIKKIHHMAGAREDESQDALELLVENVAVHLSDSTRREFAAKLPKELQGAAMMVPTANLIDDDLLEQMMDLDDVDERRARDYLRAAWDAVCELFDRESVRDITNELPRKMVAVLE